MLPLQTREQLLKNQSFVDRHRKYTGMITTREVFLNGLRDLNYDLPTSPVIDPIQHRALRDAFKEGMTAIATYFLEFLDEGEVPQTTPGFEPLEHPDLDDMTRGDN